MAPESPKSGSWERIWEIFHEALETSPEDRPATVERLCAESPELQSRVEELLEAHSQNVPILDEQPALDNLPGPEPSSEEGREFLPPGTVLQGRFEIVDRIGVGGMGEVYEARDRELEQPLAIKTLHSTLIWDTAAVARFRNEILLARQVTHRNVCRAFDLFQHDGRVFLTMELLRGKTLAERLSETRLQRTEIERIVSQVVEGLEAAHSVGVHHRDLKPSNILLVEDPTGTRAVITDFGLATSVSGHETETGLTRPGQIVGTPAYMAPEQLEGKPTGAAADVYALGLILFEMVTGRQPIDGANLFSIANRRLNHAPPSPRVHAPNVDDRWEAVILRCLDRDPEKRFETPADVLTALRGESSDTGPMKPKRFAWSGWGTVGGITAGLFLTALVLWGFRTDAPEPGGEPEAAGTTSSLEPIFDPGPREAILIADFENRTGHPELDGLLRSALAREIAQSTHVTVASRTRVDDALTLMRLPHDTSIDVGLGRQVAQRDGAIPGIVVGSAELVGRSIVLAADLVATGDGSIQNSWTVRSDQGLDDLPDAISRLAFEVRAGLGESLADLDSSHRNLQQVTTPSLRALRLYEEAEALIARSGRDATSEELLRSAIREDADFASAHMLFAFAIYNQGRSMEEWLPAAERAKELADKVPDRERYFIRGSHALLTGDTARAEAAYRALLRLHPDHYWGNSNLAYLLGPTGGIPYQVRKARYRPNDLDACWDAAHALAIIGNRPEDARPFIERVVQLAEVEIPRWQDFEAAWARLWPAHVAWVSGDLDAAREVLDQWATELDRQSGAESRWHRRLLARGYRSLGMTERASAVLPLPAFATKRRFYSHLDMFFSGTDEADTIAEPAWSERWWGDFLVEDLTRVADLAGRGRIDRAREIQQAFELQPRAPSPEIEESPELVSTIMRARISLLEGKHREASDSLESLASHDWEAYGAAYYLLRQTLADAYLEQGRTDDALEVLESAVAQKARSYPYGMEFWMHTQLRLARLHRETGDSERARVLEQELSTYTALADPGFWLLGALRGTSL